MGGLGNYLFQIASAYSYGIEYNKKLILTINDSVKVHNHLSTYKSNILSNIEFYDYKNLNGYKIYNEKSFDYNFLEYLDGDVCLNGYFQSEKYFKKYEKEVRTLFSYPYEYLISIKEKYKNILLDKTCSIHVRRGDYLSKPEFHPTQSVEYYERAIELINDEFILLVFSDDIDWCKKNLMNLNKRTIFLHGNPDYEDLLLMSLCKSNIIANSSFSWWAAWLNNNSEKKVVAPSNWFGSSYNNHNTKDLYCDSWLII